MPSDKQKSGHGFTVMELIVVVIVLSVLVSLAAVQYNRVMEISVERDAGIRLMAIATQIEVYKIRHGNYPPPMDSVSKINDTLGTNFKDTDKLTFACLNNFSNKWECRAISIYGWSVHIESDFMNFVPHCLSDFLGGDSCPTCDQSGCS